MHCERCDLCAILHRNRGGPQIRDKTEKDTASGNGTWRGGVGVACATKFQVGGLKILFIILSYY